MYLKFGVRLHFIDMRGWHRRISSRAAGLRAAKHSQTDDGNVGLIEKEQKSKVNVEPKITT